MGGELESALGDVGEVAEAAGVENRAGQVGVGPGSEVDQSEQARTANGAAITSSACAGGAAPRAAAATAAPSGRTIAAPTSAPKRPAAKTNAQGEPMPRKAAPAPRRKPWREADQGRPDAGDDEDGEQCLQLVADPVEPHAEPRVRARSARARCSGEPAITSIA